MRRWSRLPTWSPRRRVSTSTRSSRPQQSGACRRIEPWPAHVSRLASGPRTRGSRLRPGARRGTGRAGGGPRGPRDRCRPHRGRPGPHRLAAPVGSAAADHALRHQLCTRSQLMGAAAEVPARVKGRPACPARRANSPTRARCRPARACPAPRCSGSTCPSPISRWPSTTIEGLVGIADFGWPGVVGEFDGRRKYGVPDGPTRRGPPRCCGARSAARTVSADSSGWPGGRGRTPRTVRGWQASWANRGSARSRAIPGSTSGLGRLR